MSLDDDKDNERILMITELLAGQLTTKVREHSIRVGAGDKQREGHEFISLISTIITSLTVSTYDWLREGAGIEASDIWLEGTAKHTSLNLKANGADVFIKTIPLPYKKGT